MLVSTLYALEVLAFLRPEFAARYVRLRRSSSSSYESILCLVKYHPHAATNGYEGEPGPPRCVGVALTCSVLRRELGLVNVT